MIDLDDREQAADDLLRRDLDGRCYHCGGPDPTDYCSCARARFDRERSTAIANARFLRAWHVPGL